MRSIKTVAVFIVFTFLFSSIGYPKELSARERQIYYDAAWEMLEAEYQLSTNWYNDPGGMIEKKMGRFLNKNGITQNELDDIIERGNEMSFSDAEEKVSYELDMIHTDDLTPDESMNALKNLASKYGMSVGQVTTVFTRKLAWEE